MRSFAFLMSLGLFGAWLAEGPDAMPRTFPAHALSPIPVLYAQTQPSRWNTEELDSLLARLDLDNPFQVQRLARRLLSGEARDLSAYFQDRLQSFGREDQDSRARLVFIANELESPALLAFWVDLARRTTPGHTDERKLLLSSEKSLPAMLLRVEMSMAVRNIRHLSLQLPEARSMLEALVREPGLCPEDKTFRLQAFQALKTLDPPAALKLMFQLGSDDPLKKALTLEPI